MNIWNPHFHETSPLFSPIVPAFNRLSTEVTNWPTLNNFNQLIDNRIINENGKVIHFVQQETQNTTFESEYEPRIYYSGEVQTRVNNWHDFFQVMVWQTFPKIKSLLNRVHYEASSVRIKNNIKQRGKKENFVTLFDECGSIIISSEKQTLSLIQSFRWNDLFVENKSAFGNSIDCITFGHAMYEKALSPYIGMTAHSLLLTVDSGYFLLSMLEKTKFIDEIVSTHIKNLKELSPQDLNPLPILGVPGWKKDQTADFYNNQSYFRTGRRKK